VSFRTQRGLAVERASWRDPRGARRGCYHHKRPHRARRIRVAAAADDATNPARGDRSQEVTADTPPAPPIPSRRVLIREVQAYAKPDTARGVALAALDIALYVAGIAGVLFLRSLWAKIGCSLFAGLALGRMFSLAHNAAHENIVAGRRLNRFLATMLFTPFFYNRRLWAYEHHALHHPFPNDTKSDAYKPYSRQEFDALPRWRRMLERFYRSPNVVGWGVYYLLERHWSTKIYPPSYLPRALRAAAWRNTALLGAYAVLLFGLLAAAPDYAVDLTAPEAILLGFALPLFLFEIQDGFALYVQHTDPRIAWFKGAVDRNAEGRAEGRAELLSVHLVVPRVMGWFYHDTFAHPVHHLHPKIPCYRVYEAQKHLDRRLGSAAVVRPLGWRSLLDTMRRCKLYDWDRHRWLDFDGSPTTEPITLHRCTRSSRRG
jgi:omega-6 fatty acid desaturase (delta-12 desaturase)